MAPMLVLAGGHDQLVPLGATAAAVTRLTRREATGPAVAATGGHSFVVFPDAGHGIFEAGTPGWAVIERFLGRCLGRPSGPWDGLLDGHVIDARIAALPGLDEAVRDRDPERRSPTEVPFLVDGPILPLADWIPR